MGQGEASAQLTASVTGDCVTCIKRVLIICSAIIALLGVFMMAVAVWIFLENDDISNILMSNPMVKVSVNCVLCLGILLFILGLVGFTGAFHQKQFMLSSFFMAIIFIFIVQLVGGILVFLHRDKLYKKHFTKQLAEKVLQGDATNLDSANSTLAQAWKRTMSGLNCCGVNGPDDVKMTASGVVTYPKACCSSSGGECTVPDRNKGCYEKVLSDYETYAYFAGALSIVVLIVELSSMFLAVMLYREL